MDLSLTTLITTAIFLIKSIIFILIINFNAILIIIKVVIKE